MSEAKLGIQKIKILDENLDYSFGSPASARAFAEDDMEFEA